MTDRIFELDSGNVLIRGFDDGLIRAGDEFELVYRASVGWLGFAPTPAEFAADVAAQLADGRLVFSYDSVDDHSRMDPGQSLIGDVLDVRGEAGNDGEVRAVARVRMVLADDRPPEERGELQAAFPIVTFLVAVGGVLAVLWGVDAVLESGAEILRASAPVLGASPVTGFNLADALVLGAGALLVAQLVKARA